MCVKMNCRILIGPVSDNVDATETQPDGGVDVPDATGDVVGALKHLEPGKPLILNDGFVIADSGYMVTMPLRRIRNE